MLPFKKLGIIGGGQLAKMMALSAKQMGFYVLVLDPNPDCPASSVCDDLIVSGFYDQDGLKNFVEKCEVTTYDIEHIDTEILIKLFDEGHKIYPSPHTLHLINNKLEQNITLESHGIPVPKFRKVLNPEELLSEIKSQFSFPVVQKAEKGGYDGKGVQIIKTEKDLNKAIKAPSFLEEFIDLEMELAVNIAKALDGSIAIYPVVEMTFHPGDNLCDSIIYPASIPEKVEKKAKKLAKQVIELLPESSFGIFAIEMFLTKDGRLLVNEIAPRPHNSGHYTIEASLTSQFEQHIRAVSGLPLGSTKPRANMKAAIMINLLGKEGESGIHNFKEAKEILKIEGASLHLYGKKETRPMRKLGHITVLGKDLNEAKQKSEKIKRMISN